MQRRTAGLADLPAMNHARKKWNFTKILSTCQDADTLGTEKD